MQTPEPTAAHTPWRCRLGRHSYVKHEAQRHQETPWLTSYTNAICERCGKLAWFNWRGPIS